MTRPHTAADVTATLRVEGGWLAACLFRLAEFCGLEIHVESVTFDEPVQAIADRLLIERLTAPNP